MTQATVSAQPRRPRFGAYLDPPRWQGPVALLSVSLLTAGAWVLGVLLPYYVNDLDSLPMSEVTSGAHDPKDLWPVNAFPGGGLPHVAGVFAALGGSTVVGGVAVWTVWSLAGRWSLISPLLRLVYIAAFVISVVTLAVMATPFARHLLVWSLD